MADDDIHLTADPAPLPRHERAWRHPSEIGQQRRALSRRSAPPLSPLVASLCGALGLALVIALVGLVLPPSAQRETVRQVRNAAVATPRTTGDTPALPGLMTIDGARFALDVGPTASGERLFVTLGTPSSVVVDDDGREVPLTVVRRQGGLTVLSGVVSAQATPPVGSPSNAEPATGTDVVVSGRNVVSAVIGIAVNTDVRSFVPLDGDILTANVAESSVVLDVSGRVLGLYTERDGARGYVPISVINEALLRP